MMRVCTPTSPRTAIAVTQQDLAIFSSPSGVSKPGGPSPPYSSGTAMPSTPNSASCFMLSHGNVPSIQRGARSRNSDWARARTLAMNWRCSSVRVGNTGFLRAGLTEGAIMRSGTAHDKPGDGEATGAHKAGEGLAADGHAGAGGVDD